MSFLTEKFGSRVVYDLRTRSSIRFNKVSAFVTNKLGFWIGLQDKEILISPFDEDAMSIFDVGSSGTSPSSCPLVSVDEGRILVMESLLDSVDGFSVEESPFVVGSVKF